MPPHFTFGAGDVHLDEVNIRIRNLLDHALVLLDRVAGDVGDNFGVVPAQERNLLLDEAVNARVLQTDTVENTLRGLRDARRRIAETLGRCQTLHADAAKLGQVKKFAVLMAETKGAGCGRDRVFQLNTAKVHS